MKPFRIRLNCIDHYQAKPTALDPQLYHDGPRVGNTKARVPIIRVFGATPTGQKVCLHVHGMFPYLFIEYAGSVDAEELEQYIHRLHLSIDHALAVSFRRTPGSDQSSYVAHISLVKGVPFYGYYVGYKAFLKVYLFNPLHIVRLADLLRQGAVMRKALQPFESHIQYVPQWMCDYNLFGCDYMDCEQVRFRQPIPRQDEVTHPSLDWHDGSIASELICGQDFARQSHCALEVDVCVWDILNRHGFKAREIHQHFMEGFSSSQIEDKLVTSMAGLWKDETRRRKARMGLKNSDGSPFPPEVLVSVSADPRNTQPGGWIHEEEYRAQIRGLIQTEQSSDTGPPAFVHDSENDLAHNASIRTSFESVQDLYPENLAETLSIRRSLRGRASSAQQSDENEIQVDEGQARSYEQEQTLDESDDDPSKQIDNELTEDQQNPVLADEDGNPTVLNEAPVLPQPAIVPQEALTSRYKLPPAGVRDVGEYVTSGDDDAFEIPSGFSSNIGGAVEQLVSSKRPLQDREKQDKRRKVYHGNGTDPSTSPINSTKLLNGKAKAPQDRTDSQHRHRQIEKDENNVRIAARTQEKIKSDARGKASLSGADAASAMAMEKNPRGRKASQPGKDQPAATSMNSEDSDDAMHRQISNVTALMRGSFGLIEQSNLYLYNSKPPPSAAVLKELLQRGLPSEIHLEAHYGKEVDVPEQSRVYGGKEFRIPGTTVPFLPEFDATGRPPLPVRKPPKLRDEHPIDFDVERSSCPLGTWELVNTPPTRNEVASWLALEASKRKKSDPASDTQLKQMSQIDAPTQKNKFGFKYSQKKPSKNVTTEAQYMNIMSLEVHVNSRAQLKPDPEFDEITCVFWCLQSENGGEEIEEIHDSLEMGIVILSDPAEEISNRIRRDREIQVDEESSELDILNKVVDIVRLLDPDILTGFEVHDGSWGYLIERARRKYEFNMCDELSRVKSDSHGRFGREADRWGFNQTSTIRVTGRHMINIWRAIRGELDLLQYTMENIAFHVLHRRIPHYPAWELTKWYRSGRPAELGRVLDYWLSRAKVDLEILQQNELVPRTSEQARLLGIDFYAVFARGSQFKVESLMSRIAKPESLLLVSPSRKQVGQQNALECIPMVMEPQSSYYSHPVLVLDFQSLYPSVMIAYNYCYSTFLGRVVPWRGQNKMGFTDYARQSGLLGALESKINIAPNGIMYAKPEVRKSLLAKMLGEILETRVMVKSGMKVDTEDRRLQRLLNNRQLALKLIANVTYGYTSASFSGRMPCVEIADSIVQTGRETLERAIALIHSVKRWRAEVVYGDTDSLFVLLKGRTRNQAFDIGQDIAKTITDMNPRPVKLKFEKVYHGCVLLAKKRYVGFKYEHKNQQEPEFDAKGIETVRRDGTPAEQKIEETALKILFRTSDLSQVKGYVQRQCLKIMQGRVSIQDFCFAKEVKMGTYSDKGPPPPGALIATRKMLEDPRAEPQYGERVPYVVITGAPGTRLGLRCVDPDILLRNEDNELDAEYYISKNILPPLERIFNLVGANVRQWYEEMPKFQRVRKFEAPQQQQQPQSHGAELMSAKRTLESYLRASACLVCKDKLEGSDRPDAGMPICPSCRAQPANALLALRTKMRKAEAKAVELHKVCRSCAGIPFGDPIGCDSKDCPVFYSRVRHMAKLRSSKTGILPIIRVLESAEVDLEW